MGSTRDCNWVAQQSSFIVVKQFCILICGGDIQICTCDKKSQNYTQTKKCMQN